MLLRSLTFLLAASASALAQTVYDSAHNVTPITGTWSSGSMNVTTGAVRLFRPRFFFWLALITHPRIVVCTAKRQNLHFPSEYWYLFFIVRIVSFF